MARNTATIPSGPGAATLLAAGIGSFALGLLTTLAAANRGIAGALNLYNPVGPLSGKTTVAVITWLLAWALLNARWKHRTVDLGQVWWTTLGLIILGLLGTFPLFFELFE